MTLAVINPGGWAPEEVLTSDQMNALQSELIKALDGIGGGSYTLTAPLIIGGSEVRFSTVLRLLAGGFFNVDAGGEISVTGVIDIEDGGQIDVKDGGRIDVRSGAGLHLDAGAECDIDTDVDLAATKTLFLHGTIDVLGTGSGGAIIARNGSTITLDGTVNMTFNSELNLALGADIVCANGAQVQVYDSEDLLINNSSFAFRLTLTPVYISSTGGVPDFFASAGFSTPKWVQHASGGLIVFALPLKPGDQLTTLRVNLTGKVGAVGHVGAPTGLPHVTLYSADINGDQTFIADADDPVATLPAYNSPHGITLSGGLLPFLVTDHALYIVVRGEQTGFEADKTAVLSIDGTGVARGFRGPLEFY